MTHSDENKVDGIVLVTEDSQAYLNPKQEIADREHRRELANWLLNIGKTRTRPTDTAIQPPRTG